MGGAEAVVREGAGLRGPRLPEEGSLRSWAREGALSVRDSRSPEEAGLGSGGV